MNLEKHSNGFVDYVKDLLEQFFVINVRRIFGGFGIYHDGIMFALIADNELYFKGDDSSAEFFQRFGSERFSYKAKNKQISLSYWKATSDIFDSPELLKEWMDIAYNAAISSKRKL
jgi:DNA transformation protein and related proteins